MSSLDTLAERRVRSLLVADVRTFDPRVRIGDADLAIMSGWKQHDDRWMEWRFNGVKIEGYFHSAHGAHAAGWTEWLRRTMTPAEYDAYQAGDRAGWQRRDRGASREDRAGGNPLDGLRMRRVIRCVIKAEFTPDQWGLTVTSGRDEAAATLNETLRNAVNAGDSSPASVFEKMNPVQSGFADLEGDGATARNLVAQVVRLVYGND